MTALFPLPVVDVEAITKPTDHFNCTMLLPGRRSILSAASCIGRQESVRKHTNGAVESVHHNFAMSACAHDCQLGAKVRERLPAYRAPAARYKTPEEHKKLREARDKYHCRPSGKATCPWCKASYQYDREWRRGATCGKPECKVAAIRAANARRYGDFCIRCRKRRASKKLCYRCRATDKAREARRSAKIARLAEKKRGSPNQIDTLVRAAHKFNPKRKT